MHKTVTLLVLCLALVSAQNFPDIIDGTWLSTDIALTLDFCTHSTNGNVTTSARLSAGSLDGTTQYYALVGEPSFDAESGETYIHGNYYGAGFPLRNAPGEYLSDKYCADTSFTLQIPADPEENSRIIFDCNVRNGDYVLADIAKINPNVPSNDDCFRLSSTETIGGNFGPSKTDSHVCVVDNGDGDWSFHYSRAQKGNGINEFAHGLVYWEGAVGSSQVYDAASNKSNAGYPLLVLSLYSGKLAHVKGWDQTVTLLSRFDGTPTDEDCNLHRVFAPTYSGYYKNIFNGMPGVFTYEFAGELTIQYDYIGVIGGTTSDGVYFPSSFFEAGAGQRACAWGDVNVTFVNDEMELTFFCGDNSGQPNTNFKRQRFAAGVANKNVNAVGAVVNPAAHTFAGEWNEESSLFDGTPATFFWDICLLDEMFVTETNSYNSSYGRRNDNGVYPQGFELGPAFLQGRVGSGTFYEPRGQQIPFTGYSLNVIRDNGVFVNFYYYVEKNPFSTIINGNLGTHFDFSIYTEQDIESDGQGDCNEYSYLLENLVPAPAPAATPVSVIPVPPPSPAPGSPPSPSPAPFSAASTMEVSALFVALVALTQLL